MTNVLKNYLEKRQESPFSFAKRCGVSLPTIYKIMHGTIPRKDVAKKIVRCTKKEITLKDFGYE